MRRTVAKPGNAFVPGSQTDPDARMRIALHELIGEDYEVLRLIGKGGMAKVFLGRHLRHHGLVAIKVLAEDLAAQPDFVERFEHEAKTVAKLDHPNIVQIIDVNSGNGWHWLIMPYIDGEDLEVYLQRRGTVPVAEAISIVRSVADALAHAAKEKIIHRDIKPSNIRIDSNGRVFVLDFGIAKAADQPGLTRPGQNQPGTPNYMSPEQDRNGECTHQSDLYSLGLVFFELLTGRNPRSEPDGFDSRGNVVLGSLDRNVGRIIQRLLEPLPADRYGSADELIRDLAAIAPQPFHLGRRTRWLWGIVAVTAVSLGATALIVKRPPPGPPVQIQDAHGVMVLVPAGKFIFGDNSEVSPYDRQELTLPTFYIDATETSNAQYASFTQATGHSAPPSQDFLTADKMPVVNVTFADAEAYCFWAGRRLPTEQEWEKAARGPQGLIYPWGNHALVNPGNLVTVDAYPERRSWTGALNLSGNVFEWTSSGFPAGKEFIEDMKRITGRPTITTDWRVLKGGSFLVKNELFFRSYMRRGWPVDEPTQSIGFRCVKDVK